jgi:hypothetical protein
MLRHSVILYVICYGLTWYGMVRYGMVWYDMIHHNLVLVWRTPDVSDVWFSGLYTAVM